MFGASRDHVPPGAPSAHGTRGDGLHSAVSARATYAAIVLLTAMNLLNYIDRFVLPAVIETVRRDIPMSDTEQGFALASFILVYMVAAPVFGRLGERVSRTRIIAVGVALWSLATAAAGFAQSYGALLAARSLVGIGEAAYATLAPALIGDYFPEAKRGRVMTLFYLAIPIGSALGYVLGGQLAHAFSWRVAFFAVGGPGLLLAAAALAIREPPRGQFDREPGEVLPLGATLRALARNRVYVWTVAGYTAYTFALGGLAQWMPTYLMRVRHLDGAEANTLFGAVTVLAGLAGTAVGGALAESLRGRVRQPYLWVSGVSTLLAAPVALLAFRLESTTGLWSAIATAEFLVFMSTGPINTVLVNCVGATMRSTAFAFSILLTHLLGDALSPSLIGVASDRTSLQSAVLLVPLTFLLAGFFWLHGQRRSP
jgi:MFS family permease